MGTARVIFWVGMAGVVLGMLGWRGQQAQNARKHCISREIGTVSGELEFRRPGVWRLRGGEREGFWGAPLVYWDGAPSWEGARVRVTGRISCRRRYRNPHSGTGFRIFSPPTWRIQAHQVAGPPTGKMRRGRAGAPHLSQWARAVWEARGEGLDPRLWEGARGLGILPVLVQSGQHVWVLAAALVPLAGRWSRVVAVGLLALFHVSLPLGRILATAGLSLGLRARGLAVSPVQLLTSVLALHLVAFPGHADTAGLWLTYLGAVALVQGGLGRVSVAVLPLLAGFFGAVPLAGALMMGTVGWMWNGLAIPLGFVAPVLGPAALVWGEAAWNAWVGWHRIGIGELMAVRRPSGWETGIAVGLMLCAAPRRKRRG